MLLGVGGASAGVSGATPGVRGGSCLDEENLLARKPDFPVDMLGALLPGRLGARLEGGLQLSPSEEDDEMVDGGLARPMSE